MRSGPPAARPFAAGTSTTGLGLLAGLVVLAACGGGEEPDGVRLRFDYSVGDTLRYGYHSSGTVTIPDTTAPGGTTRRPYERTMRIDEVAEEVTPRGHYRLAITYHLPADTARGTPPPAPITIRYEMTPQGKILSVSGVETAKPLFGDIDFESYFEQAQPTFPERPLKVGDSWTQEVRVVAPGVEPVTTSSTYVLEALAEEGGEPVATIAFDGEIYLPIGHGSASAESAASAPAQLAEERIRVEGTITFAYERGVMRRLETRARATVTKHAVEAGEAKRHDLHIDETSRIELIDR